MKLKIDTFESSPFLLRAINNRVVKWQLRQVTWFPLAVAIGAYATFTIDLPIALSLVIIGVVADIGAKALLNFLEVRRVRSTFKVKEIKGLDKKINTGEATLEDKYRLADLLYQRAACYQIDDSSFNHGQKLDIHLECSFECLLKFYDLFSRFFTKDKIIAALISKKIIPFLCLRKDFSIARKLYKDISDHLIQLKSDDADSAVLSEKPKIEMAANAFYKFIYMTMWLNCDEEFMHSQFKLETYRSTYNKIKDVGDYQEQMKIIFDSNKNPLEPIKGINQSHPAAIIAGIEDSRAAFI